MGNEGADGGGGADGAAIPVMEVGGVVVVMVVVGVALAVRVVVVVVVVVGRQDGGCVRAGCGDGGGGRGACVGESRRIAHVSNLGPDRIH